MGAFRPPVLCFMITNSMVLSSPTVSTFPWHSWVAFDIDFRRAVADKRSVGTGRALTEADMSSSYVEIIDTPSDLSIPDSLPALSLIKKGLRYSCFLFRHIATCCPTRSRQNALAYFPIDVKRFTVFFIIFIKRVFNFFILQAFFYFRATKIYAIWGLFLVKL